MNDQGNPFLYGRPVEQAEELIDSEGEWRGGGRGDGAGRQGRGAVDEAEPEIRAILDEEMSPPRRAAFVALCKEPTDEPYSRPNMRRHGIKGSGALKSALDGLAASGYLERKRTGARPEPTDPLLALWIRERMNGS